MNKAGGDMISALCGLNELLLVRLTEAERKISALEKEVEQLKYGKFVSQRTQSGDAIDKSVIVNVHPDSSRRGEPR